MLIGLISIINACRPDLNQPNIEGEILAPIANASLNVQNLLSDSLVQSDENNLVSIVYRSTLYNSQLGAFEPLETREFNQTVKLQELSLGSQSATRTISLGQVATNAGPLGTLLINQHGSNGFIPPVPGLTYGPLAVDGSAFFETVTLDSGYMDVRISNGFPTGISNIEFEIRNESDNSLVGQSSFANVAAGATETETIDLAGKTIDGNLVANILNFDVDGSGGAQVPIDTTDELIVNIIVRDMKVFSATAIFPAQDILTLNDTSAMNGVNDLKITRAIAAKGVVNLRVVSTIEDTMFFDYLIPGGTKDGVPFEIHEKIDPAPSGGSIERILQYSVNGYEFDLTGSPVINQFNAFYSELTGRIDSTGKLVNLSLDDSLLLYIQLGDFIPEYAEGYLGSSDTTIGPQSIPVDLFKNISSGSINFEEVKLGFGVSNGNGVPFDVEIQSLKAINSNTNSSVDMNLGSLPSTLNIGAASDISTPTISSWEVTDAGNSINEALNIFPNQFESRIRVTSNATQDSNNLSQFAVDSNLLEAFVDLEVPLNFSANQLVLTDTVAFNASSFQNPEQIKSGLLYIIAHNSYPLLADLELQFLDAGDLVVETIVFDKSIEASTDSEPVPSALQWAFTTESLETLLASKKVIFKLQLSSVGDAPVKIYSNQTIDLSITSRFQYITAE